MPLPTLYGQRLPQWAAKHYGLPQADVKSTIGAYGCKLACYSMILAVPPDALQDIFAAKDVYLPQDTFNFIRDGQVAALYPQLVYNDRIDCPNDPAPMDVVDQLLDSNGYVLVYVNATLDLPPAQRDKKLRQHYILILGKEQDNYRIFDPWHNDVALISPRYGSKPQYAICGIIKLVRKQ